MTKSERMEMEREFLQCVRKMTEEEKKELLILMIEKANRARVKRDFNVT